MNKCNNYEICKNVTNNEENICLECLKTINFPYIEKYYLKFIENLEECKICYNYNTKGVSFNTCDHYICLLCFEKLIYNTLNMKMPKEPYSEDIMNLLFYNEINGNCVSIEELCDQYPLLVEYIREERRVNFIRDYMREKDHEYISIECFFC